MFKIKALITTIVLGLSSSAMASPTVSFSAQANLSWGTRYREPVRTPVVIRTPVRMPVRAPIVRDHRFHQGTFNDEVLSFEQPREYDWAGGRAQWTSLGTVTAYVLKGDLQQFTLPRYSGRITQLKLQSHGGESYMYQVRINFADGRTQIVNLNRYVGSQGSDSSSPASPSFTIDVQGRSPIVNVVIDGLNDRGAAYSLLAS